MFIARETCQLCAEDEGEADGFADGDGEGDGEGDGRGDGEAPMMCAIAFSAASRTAG